MNKLDYVLDFCKELAKSMLVSGANIERVNLSCEKICHAYGLHDVTCASMSRRVEIAAKDKDQNYSSRQTDVPPLAINLEKLKKLNSLSFMVAHELPDPSTLRGLLSEIKTNDFPVWAILLGNIVALLGLGRIFNAGWTDLIMITINTVLIFFSLKLFDKIKLNKIIVNFLTMFVCSLLTLGLYKAGFVKSFFVVLICNTFLLIPGIPMINCARNLLCGNELNGLVDFFKVFLEVCTIVAGIAAGYFCFGDLEVDIISEMVSTNPKNLLQNIELVFATLMATAGFSIGFNIQLSDFVYAMCGGIIIRICLILFSLAFPDYKFLYFTLASFCAAGYSEILANIKKSPATLFLYPSIIPLIPGDLICLVSLGFIWQNPNLIAFGSSLAYILLGISFGFVICSSAAHYIRKFKFKRTIKETE